MSDLEIIATLAGALLLGVGVPVLAMRMLAPSLAQSNRAITTNFRGRTVFYGLGIVWLVWAGCAIVGGVLVSLSGDSVTPVLAVAGALALVAVALGLVDDAYGTSAARGFKGHLSAMAKGRLTTGGLKLLGIGTACLVAALTVGPATPWGSSMGSPLAFFGVALLAGAAMAFTSNFINLTDLRPGRALKVYLLLCVFGVLSAGWALGVSPLAQAAGIGLTQRLVDSVVLALFLLGPAAAVWRLDVGEHGMLGDAGANPMGVVAGLMIVVGLPLWALVAYFALMLALNLVSERVSFSMVIESTPFLRRLDEIGRDRSDDTPP